MKKRATVRPRRRIEEITEFPSGMSRAFLSEDYDGIGQYVMVSLSRLTMGSAYKARVASGDFGGGRTFPAGTPVVIHSFRGKVEVFLGNQPKKVVTCGLSGWELDWGDKNPPYATTSTASWYYRSARPVAWAANEDLQFIVQRVANYESYENDPMAAREFILGSGPNVELSFRFKMSGGPIAYSGFIPFYPVELVTFITETDVRTGLSPIGANAVLVLGTGSGSSGTNPNHLYGWHNLWGPYGSTVSNAEFSDEIPILTDVWDRWIWVRMRTDKDGVSSALWFDGEEPPSSDQLYWHTSPSEMGGLLRAQTIAFQSYAVGSSTVDPNVKAFVNIDEITVLTEDCGWVDRFNNYPQENGWGISTLGDNPWEVHEPENAHLFSVTEHELGMENGNIGWFGVARLDYVEASNPVGNPGIGTNLGVDLLELAAASPLGHVDIAIHFSMFADPTPTSEFEASFSVYLSDERRRGDGHLLIGNNYSAVEVFNSGASFRRLACYVDDSANGASANSPPTSFNVLATSCWLYIRISPTSFKAQVESEDSRWPDFSSGPSAQVSGVIQGSRNWLHFQGVFVNTRMLLEVNQIFIRDGASQLNTPLA